MTLNLTARILPKFPARVAAGAGMLITKLNGIWTFAVNGGNLVAQGSVTDPANTFVLVQLPDGTTAKVPLSVALATAQPVEFPGRRNALINGGMLVWQRGANFAGANAITTARAYTGDRWAVKTGAGTLLSVGRNNHGLNVPPTGPRSGAMMAISGAVGVTTVDIDQRVEGSTSGGSFLLINQLVCAPQIAFSAFINNTTGAAFTPTLFVETPNAIDNWAGSAIVNGGGAGEALQSCPNGVWTRVTWVGDPSGYANRGNGIGFRLRIPSGSLDNNAKVISITDVMVEPRYIADGLFSQFPIEDFAAELLRCQRYYQKTFPYGLFPAQNLGQAGSLAVSQTVGAAASMRGWAARWTTVMRTTPTVTFFNPSAANALARNVDAAADTTVTSAVDTGDAGMAILITTSAGSAAGNRNIVHYTLDAEI